MSAKKKSHGILFSPYLQKGEDLLWLGMPVKNKYLRFHFDAYARRKFSFIVFAVYMLVLLAILFVTGLERVPSAEIVTFLLGIFVFSSLLLAFIMIFATWGKVYYAITTKRLLILRRPLWKSLDATALILLPQFQLEIAGDGTKSLRFVPLRKEEVYDRGRVSYVDVHRSHLDKLNSEDAEMAFELLTAAQNDILDQRAREIGLMD